PGPAPPDPARPSSSRTSCGTGPGWKPSYPTASPPRTPSPLALPGRENAPAPPFPTARSSNWSANSATRNTCRAPREPTWPGTCSSPRHRSRSGSRTGGTRPRGKS
ncbi:hypothetical protein HGM15179_019836, partial [Zosterops borbonicus]